MIDQALKHTNLLELRERSIQTLSGGQMQRVFIAMVLAQDTEIVLLDEPLNHLDLKQAVEIMKLLRYMVENLDKTVVIVMHDLNMAINFSDYLVAFKEGKCEFHGKTMDVVTNQTLSELYEIDIEVIEVSGKKYSKVGEKYEKIINNRSNGSNIFISFLWNKNNKCNINYSGKFSKTSTINRWIRNC